MAALLAGVLAGSGLWAGSLSGAGPNDKGPLDPLSAAEILTTLEVIEASNKYPAGAFLPLVKLSEPPNELHAWGRQGRRSHEGVRQRLRPQREPLYEAVVDLNTTARSWTQRAGAQPAVYFSEWADADALVRAYAPWKKAMSDRSLDPKDVYVDTGPGRTHPTPRLGGRGS